MVERCKTYDIVVIGGGLAGVCAALAAARLGSSVALLQDRPVLGGNSSSEIRVSPHGAAAFHHYARETGILSELLEEERFRNHEEIFENGWTNSVWDMVLYDACVREEKLDLHLNTPVLSVDMASDRQIRSVRARILAAEVDLIISGEIFIDATGDGLVADAAGCRSMRGSESRSTYGEIHAPEQGRREDEMGNSLHFRIKDVGRPVDFVPPDWAVKHDDPAYFWESGRKLKDLRGGFWWIEIGKPWDTITDSEIIRHELTRHLLGIWDWMKNKDPRTRAECRNLALDWIGQVPGKRESRRIVGRYLMTENDIQKRQAFEDEIGFGGWFLDLHTPGGLLAEHSEERSKESYSPYGQKGADSYVGPYAIPYSVICPADVDNLFLAGRSLSLTHAAFGSVRVMGTLAVLGQAAGTAAVRCLGRLSGAPGGALGGAVDVRAADGGAVDVRADVRALQQRLLRDGVFLLGEHDPDSNDLAQAARVSASSSARLEGAAPVNLGGEAWSDGGIGYWKDQVDPRITDHLDTVHAQLIPVSGGVDVLHAFLSNEGGAAEVAARLFVSGHIWDYRMDTGKLLAETVLTVPPGEGWVAWPLNIPDEGSRLLRLDIGPNKNISWLNSGSVLPGCISYFGITAERLRSYAQGATLSFRIEPPQEAYPPENILNGCTRPYRNTGCWRSDPDPDSDPGSPPSTPWIRLDWKNPVMVALVELTFPGQLLREYHAYPPNYRDPQIPRDYVLEGSGGGASAESAGSWVELARVRGNYKRRRHHRMEAIRLSALRLRVLAGNGDPAAAVYEIRCYAEDKIRWSE